MKFKYEIGMRICDRVHPERKGAITREDKNGYGFWFQWDKETGFVYTDDEYHVSDYEREIMPDTDEARVYMAEVKQKTQAKIDEATHFLEQAFKSWFEAASLQAGYDVGNSEAYYLMGRGLDLSKFEDVVEVNGWSTSSLYC